MNPYRNVIVAPVTALVNQTVAIIRLSGPNVFPLVASIIDRPCRIKANQFYYRNIIANEQIVDEVLLLFFIAPVSFTGEDVVEIQCHGNVFIVEKIINLLLRKGARFAKRGEFSERAFWNDKLNFTKAEAINDLIQSNSPAAAQMFVNNMQPQQQKHLAAIQQKLLDLISNIEVNIDYPEYDGVGHLSTETVKKWLQQLAAETQQLLDLSFQASLLAEGVKVVILGAPNVGKSSLLNALVQEEKAIVSHLAGTTRDVVEGTVHLPTVTLKFLDTAGIRTTSNEIEQIGVQKALQLLKQVNFVIVVFDASQNTLSDADRQLLKLVQTKKHLILLNKTDLGTSLINNYEWDQQVVALSLLQDSIQPLINQISQTFAFDEVLNQSEIVFTKQSQQDLLRKIHQQLTNCMQQEESLSLDLMSRELQEVWQWIQQLTGQGIEENILETMFRNYCLGK